MSPDNVDVVREVMSAFVRRDLKTLLALHDPEFQSIPASAAARAGEPVHQGHAMLRDWWQRVWRKGGAVHYDDSQFIEAGEDVVVIARGSVRYSNREREKVFVPVVYTVRDGRLIRARVYESEQAALEAVGLPE